MSAESLLSLHDKLRADRWRAKHAFSKDMQQAAKLMLSPSHTTTRERKFFGTGA